MSKKKKTTENTVLETSDDKLLDDFHSMETKNEMADIIKELFDKKKIYMIADLSKDEIRLATRIWTIADMKNIEIWKKGLRFYVEALLSNKRQSRREILDAIKGYFTKPSFWEKMGFGGRDRGV